MAGQEGLVALALALQRLQFGSHVNRAVAVVADIERNHADGVAGDEEGIALLVVKDEGKDAVEVLEEVDALLAIERQDDFTVAPGLKLIAVGQAAPDILMVVNFAVHGQHLTAVGREEGLAARLGIDDAQALVGQDGGGAAIDAAPVRPAVTDFLTHTQSLLTQRLRRLLNVQQSYDATHIWLRVKGSGFKIQG